MARHPDGEDATPTSGPAPERVRKPVRCRSCGAQAVAGEPCEHCGSDPGAAPPTKPGRTDVIVAKAVQAARATAQALPADNDSASIAALASIVNRALLLVGLVVLVLGGMVGVYLSVPGLGRAVPAAPPSSPPAASPVAPGVP